MQILVIAIAALIVAMLAAPRYAVASVGVISVAFFAALAFGFVLLVYSLIAGQAVL